MSDPDTTQSLSEPNIYVALTHQTLDIPTTINRIRSPEAGAIVLFAGKPPLLPLIPSPSPPPSPSPVLPLPPSSPSLISIPIPTPPPYSLLSSQLTPPHRNNALHIRQHPRPLPNLHVLRPQSATHALNHRARHPRETRADGHRDGAPAGHGADRRGEHSDRAVGAASAGGVAGGRGGAGGV